MRSVTINGAASYDEALRGFGTQERALRREERGIPLLRRANARVDDVDIQAEDEHPAAPAGHAGGVLGAAGDDPPGLAGVGAGAGDALDGSEALGVLEVAGDAQRLADVGRADEQQIDIGHGGDLGYRL